MTFSNKMRIYVEYAHYFQDLQTMPFFSKVDWSNLSESEAPFIPQPDDETDTGYFDARNNMLQLKVSQVENF